MQAKAQHSSSEVNDMDSADQSMNEDKLLKLVEKLKELIVSRGDRLLHEAQAYHEAKVN